MSGRVVTAIGLHQLTCSSRYEPVDDFETLDLSKVRGDDLVCWNVDAD